MKKKLKISIILDKNYINWYLYDLINWCVISNKFEVLCILRNNDKTKKIYHQNILSKLIYHFSNSGFFGIINIIFWKYFNIIESKYVKKNFKIYNHHFKIYKSEQFNLKTIYLNPESFPKKKNRYIYKYTESDIEKLKRLNLDFIINGSEKVLKGEILDVPKLGIISIHHGDNRKFRGGPGGFWETYFNEKYSGYIIQILNENLDSGNVVHRSNFETKKTYLLNQINIAENGNNGYKSILNFVSKNNFFPEVEKNIIYSNKIFKMPKFWNIIFYLLKFRRYQK